MCGWSPRAQVQRAAEGFAACVPDWTEGDGVSPALLPNFDTSVTGVESSAAAKLNYVADATGYAVHTLQIC